MTIRSILVSTVLLSSLTLPINADQASTSSQAKPDAKAQQVLADLHQTNQHEVMMGQLAQEKGQSDAVRSYGQTLVQDHQQADEKVQEIAKNEGLALTPTAETPATKAETDKHAQMMQRLQSLSGAEFDKTFASAMVDGHQKNISKLRAAKKSLPTSPVSTLISQVLPTLEKHLQLAEKIKANS